MWPRFTVSVLISYIITYFAQLYFKNSCLFPVTSDSYIRLWSCYPFAYSSVHPRRSILTIECGLHLVNVETADG